MSEQPGQVAPAFEITDRPVAAGGSFQRIVDRIQERTQASLEAETIAFPVPARDGFEVAFCVFLAPEVWDALTTAHQGDPKTLGKAILRQQCREIVVDGEVWLGGDGQPVRFGSADFRGPFGARDDFEAIDRLYIRKPDVARVASAVIQATGWNVLQPVDPTRLPGSTSPES